MASQDRAAGGGARTSAGRIGLALAGGGPLGAIYEIGALCALDEALQGVDLTALDGYVGVSAGGFIAAGLANGMTPRHLCRVFIENDVAREERMDPGLFLRPAWGEFARRAAALPGLTARAAWGWAFRGDSTLAALERLGGALPTGLFSHAPVEAHLRRLLGAPGRTNDFRRLQRQLVVVATDLDSGEAAPFGRPGWDHVPISLAVAASAALPGLFAPVEIGGRSYVDGALKKTLHASVLLGQGLDLLLCLNPLVPFDARHPEPPRGPAGTEEAIPRLVQGGLPVVLSQTFRSLIHSRLELGLRGYDTSHPDTDIVLFEPDHRDPAMFDAHAFGYRQRRWLAEHAYQRTLASLRERRAELAPRLARHGVTLDDAVLSDPHRTLLGHRRPAPTRASRALTRLGGVLDDLERTITPR